MVDSDIPDFIKEMPTDIGFSLENLYQEARGVINSTLTPDQYAGALTITQERAQQDYQAGKLDLVNASKIFLTVYQLSKAVENHESEIITLCNLGLMYQNARAFDIAINFAAEAIKITYKHNLLELKLKALNVLSLVYTNTQQSEKQTEVMEEVAAIHGKLGNMEKKAEIEELIKAKKEFMELLGK
jgi:hypothetical protein